MSNGVKGIAVAFGLGLLALVLWRSLGGTRESTAVESLKESEREALLPEARVGEPVRAVSTDREAADARELAGGADEVASVDVEASPAEELPAADGLKFFGLVVDETTGAPIAGASATSATNFRSVEADVGGLIELDCATRHPGSFELRAEGYGARRFRPAPGHERPENARRLALLPVASLKVRIRDEDMRSLDSLSVRLSARSYEMNMPDELLTLTSFGSTSGGDKSWKADCGVDGVCELSDLPPRVPFEVEVMRGGEIVLRPGSFGLEPGEARKVEWTLNSGSKVIGEIVDQDGASVAGMVLGRCPGSAVGRKDVEGWIVPEHMMDEFSASTLSDEQGRFVFEDVPPGTWWIAPITPPGDARQVAAVAVRVEVPVNGPLVVQVERGLFVRGHVRTPDGSAPTHAWISAASDDRAGSAYTEMQDDTSFQLGPLASGSYRLQARSFREYANSPIVIARTGDEDIVLELQLAGMLAGTVVSAKDGAGQRAQLSLSGRGDAWSRQMSATGEDGSFEIGGLGAGVHDLSATSADGRVAVLRDIAVSSGATTGDLRLVLRRGVRVEVRYNGSAEYCQFQIESDGIPIGFDGLKTGHSSAVFVPPGPVEVVFKLGGQTMDTQRAEAREGEGLMFAFEPAD